MTACPTCGHDPGRRPRTELERQFPTHADALRAAAEATGEDPVAIGHGCIGWRGLVWQQVKLRKPSICVRTGRHIRAGEKAWRQLSEMAGRDQRVADGEWGTT